MNGMETYNGHVRSPNDAIILFEACRIGLLPRVQRRLSEKERQSIKSGSVFVWDEREAGMRRWTDGKSWSASRVSGSFLTYREMEGKRGGSSFDKTANRDGVQGNDGDSDGGPDGYRYKPDGLMKQSFSITTNNGQHLHLISYYSRQAGASSNLMIPSQDPQLRHIRPEKGMYPESTVHEQSNIPAITRGPMDAPSYSHSPTQPPYGRPPYAYTPWAPPSPMATPPPHAHYGPYYGQHHHPYAGQPPPHSMHYPPPPAPPAPYGHGHPTAFDRPPPPLNSASLPPPGGHHYAHPPPHSYSSGYPYPNYSYPPPAPSSAAHPSHAPYPPPHPAPAYEPRPPLPDSRPKEATSSLARDDRHDSTQAHAAAAEKTIPSIPASAPPSTYGSSQKIPSIHTMLNDAEPLPPRKRSRSPGGTPPRPLQDIPSHKLGFEANRDMHTLRNLDKSTFKF